MNQIAKLQHVFDLYKQNTPNPLVQVQMNVEYNHQTKEAQATGLRLYCHIAKSFLDMTPFMNKLFFQGIIAQELAVTDWDQVHKNQLYAQQALENRLRDNQAHTIGTESFIYGDRRMDANDLEMQTINDYHDRQLEQNY